MKQKKAQCLISLFIYIILFHFFFFFRSIHFFPLSIKDLEVFPQSLKVDQGMNDWRPFIYGGIASVAAESGRWCFIQMLIRLNFFLNNLIWIFWIFYSYFVTSNCKKNKIWFEFCWIQKKMALFFYDFCVKPEFIRIYWCIQEWCVLFAGTFPIDTTKTRLQVQGQTIDVRLKEIKYRGMVHALKRIYAEEGVRALYSG